MAVTDGDVYDPGGRQLLDEFGSERCGLRRTAAQTSAAAPSINLKDELQKNSCRALKMCSAVINDAGAQPHLSGGG